MNSRFFLITGMILLAAATRVLPHPSNFTAVGAMALFAGATFTDKRWAFIVPLAAMLLADMFIPGGFLPEVYVSFLVVVGIGLFISKNVNVLSVTGGTLLGSLIFFLVTNCIVFYYGTNHDMYPHTLAGQMTSYVSAIPFAINSVVLQ